MSSEIAHPFASASEESLTDRIGRMSFLLGLLGPIGFLSVLRDVHVVFELAQLFYLFFLLFFVPPAIAVIGAIHSGIRSLTGADDEDSTPANDPRSWIEMGYEPSPLKSLQAVALIVHPNTAVRGALQVAGAVVAYVRHAGRLPRPETYESSVRYRPPFDGEWTVVNGSPDERYSHSWFPVRQRYAHDFVITDSDGRTHDGSGGPESFHCFDEPILAPANGTVVRAKDGHRDHHRTTGWVDPLQYRLAGNYVVIEHADGEYSFLAHLKEGSVRVSPGEAVERGQEIGRCGHSGNSGEPHLHFHVQDHRIPYVGAGLPVQFDCVTDRPDGQAAGPGRQYVHCGQTIEYVDGTE